MTNCFAAKPDAQLLDELSQEIDTIRALGPEDQMRIVTLARSLAEREMALPFILAGIRSTAEVLADLEVSGADPVMSRPEVQQFLEANHHLPAAPPFPRQRRETDGTRTAAAENGSCHPGRALLAGPARDQEDAQRTDED